MDIGLWKRLENSTKIKDATSRWTQYREGSIALCSDPYFIWNFLPEKSYVMQCYAIVSEEVSSCE